MKSPRVLNQSKKRSSGWINTVSDWNPIIYAFIIIALRLIFMNIEMKAQSHARKEKRGFNWLKEEQHFKTWSKIYTQVKLFIFIGFKDQQMYILYFQIQDYMNNNWFFSVRFIFGVGIGVMFWGWFRLSY